MRKQTLISTKSIFTITLIVMCLTILFVWLFGLGKHKTIIENSFYSTTILSIAFFLFTTIGLYRGIKLKDNIGKVTDQYDAKKIESLKDISASTNSEIPSIGDGIEGIIFGVILWLIASIIIGLLFWLFGAILWMTVLIFVGMLYWIFFRALRLVFKKSLICKGKLGKSLLYGFSYTILYNFWIYGILLFVELKLASS